MSESGADPAPAPGGFVAPTAEALGALLPNYEISGLIAAGGMGAVYKARQPRLDRTVAIKVLPMEASAPAGSGEGSGSSVGDLNFAERFEREAQAMAKLHHSRIVGVHDFGETKEGQLYIVMEFVEGTDLHHLIKDEVLEQKQILAIITQICDALGYAHERGIVHRDIKPANIMLDVEGQVKVADFGLAKLTGANAAEQAQLTMTNMAMGTPDYVAPEQLHTGVEVDGRADIYALGVMIYEMLAGRVPRGAFQWPSEINPEVDSRMDKVVEKAMQQDRESRYQDVSELWRDVEEITSTPAVTVVEGVAPLRKLKTMEPTGRIRIKTGDGPTRKVSVKAATSLGLKEAGMSSGVMAGMMAGMIGGGVALLGVLGWLVFSGGSGDEQASPASPVDGPRSEVGSGEENANSARTGYAAVVEVPETLDLLRYVKVEEDGLNGDWSLGEAGELIAGVGKNGGHLALPVVLGSEGERLREYELRMTVRRKKGEGGFIVIFPLAETITALRLDDSGKHGAGASGIGPIEGAMIGDPRNPAWVPGRFLAVNENTEVRIAVRAPIGKDVEIEVFLGGKALTKWSGSASALGFVVRNRAVMDAIGAGRPIVFNGAGTVFEISKLELEFVDGQATLLRP